MSDASRTVLASRRGSVAFLSTISMSPPAEKARPAPVTTATRVSLSRSIVSQIWVSSQCRRSLVALSASGRFSVMSSTPFGRRSKSRCWYSLYSIIETPYAAPPILSSTLARSGRGSAVDADHLAGDEAAVVGGEERSEARDIVGRPEAPHRNLAELAADVGRVLLLLAEDRSGRDRVDGDAPRPQLPGQRLGEAPQPVLGGGDVGAPVVGTLHRVHAGDVDD